MTRRHATVCTHRWILDEPKMRTVQGICRRCGARKRFPNGVDFAGAFGEFHELDRSRPVLLTEQASLDEHLLDGVAASLSAVDRYGSVAAERC